MKVHLQNFLNSTNITYPLSVIQYLLNFFKNSKSLFISFIILCFSTSGYSQVLISQEDFEDAIGYSATEWNNNANEFFQRKGINDTEIDQISTPVANAEGSSLWAVGGLQGVNGSGTGTTDEVSLTLNDINISGFTQLNMDMLIAANSAVEFENGDYLIVEADIDNTGTFVIIGAFYGAGASASRFRRDADLSGGSADDGSGEDIGETMVDKNFTISGTGSLLDIQIRVKNSQDIEQIVFDNLRINGAITTTSTTPSHNGSAGTALNSLLLNYPVNVGTNVGTTSGTITVTRTLPTAGTPVVYNIVGDLADFSGLVSQNITLNLSNGPTFLDGETYEVDVTAGIFENITTDPTVTITGSSDWTFTIDGAAPAAPVVVSIANDTGILGNDEITNDNTITITGTSEADASVEVFIDAGSIGTTTADGSGDWTYDHTAVTLPDATYAITAQASDEVGNTGSLSAALPITILTATPATPVVVSIATDSGIDPADEITNDNTITITGTSEVNASVEVFIDAGSIGTTTADGSGDWTYDHTAVTLPDATYAITSQATDLAGNLSAVSGSLPITIDIVNAATPVVVSIANDNGVLGNDEITNDNTITITGTSEADASVEVFIDAGSIGTATADGSGDWTYDHTAVTLPDAIYAITAQATDEAGNTGSLSAALPISILTATPATPVVVSVATDSGIDPADEITNDNTITITGTSTANTSVEVFIDAGSIGTTTTDAFGDWTYDHTAVTLPDATYAITAQVFDVAGNTSALSASLPVTIDIVGATPVVVSIANDTGISGADGITSDNTITITGTSEVNASVEVFIDAGSIGTTTADGSGDWTYDHTAVTLPDATYAITAQVTDVAGNLSAVSGSLPITIDIINAATPVVVSIANDTGISGADGITSDNTITITGTSEVNASVEVFIDAGSIGTTTADGSGDWTYDHTAVTLPDATYAITAQATDEAGNTGLLSASLPISIDTGAPAAFLTTTVTTTGGNPVATYWNATDTDINVTVDIAADVSLDGGLIQLRAEVNTLGFNDLGAPVTILNGSLGATQTVTISAAVFEALNAGLLDADIVTFNAILTDVAGNSTTGTASPTLYTIDQTLPQLSPNEISINPTGDALTFTLNEEIILSEGAAVTGITTSDGTLSTIIYSDKAVSNLVTLTGSGWSAGTTSVTYSELLGNIVDIAGNELDQSTLTTHAVILNEVTLAAGDLVITGFNADGSDDFTFVLLRDIPSSTKIKFTDKGWKNTTFQSNTENSITWQPTGNMYAGTEVKITGLLASHGSVISGTALSLSSSGDQVLAYQGSSSNPTFMTGFSLGTEGTEHTTSWNVPGSGSNDAKDDSNRSALPPGLTNGVNALSIWINEDNAQYMAASLHTGSVVALLGEIVDVLNWNKRSSSAYSLTDGNNFFLPPDVVTLTPASGSRMKEDFVTLSITYSENINKDLSFGGGNITITNPLDPTFSAVIPASSAGVTATGSVVSILFNAQTILLTDGSTTKNLINNIAYEIDVDGFLFVNADGNHNEPIVGSTDWTFIYDTTPPQVASVVRKGATNPEIDDNGVVFTVTFDDVVTGVDNADFTSTGTASTGNTFAVSPNSATEYEVTVSNIDLSDAINIGGSLRLDVIDNGTILDIAGNTLSGIGNQANYIAGQNFTIIHPDPVDHITGFGVLTKSSSTITLGWTESVTNQLAQNYLILAKASSEPSYLVVGDNSFVIDDNTIFTTNKGAFSVAAGLTSFVFTGLSSGTNYDFQIIPYTNGGINILSGDRNQVLYKTNGTVPEIINEPTLFATETTIAFVSANSTVSSVDNDQASVAAVAGNFVFSVRDDGVLPAEDNIPTLINEIIIMQDAANDDIVLWTEAIAGAELSDGVSTMVASSFDDTSITFTSIAVGSGALGEVPDNTTKTYTLKIWLKSNLTGTLNLDQIIDQLNFVFKIDETNIQVETSGSSAFKTLQLANSGSLNNKVEVRATEFAINQIVSTEGINVPLINTPAISVRDGNNNLDLNYIADGGSRTVTRLGVNPFGYTANATFTFENNALLNMSSFRYTTTGDGRLHIEGLNGLGAVMTLAENTANAVEVMHSNFAFYNIAQFKPQGATTLQSAVLDMTVIGFSFSASSNGTNPNFTNITIDFKDGFNFPKDTTDIFENIRIYEVPNPAVISPIINIDYTPVPGASVNVGLSTANSIVIDGFNESLDLVNPSFYVIVADVSAAANAFTSGNIRAAVTPNIANLAPNNGSLTGFPIQGILFNFDDINSPVVVNTSPANLGLTPFTTTSFTFTFDEPVRHITGFNPGIELREFVGDALVVYDSVSITPGFPTASTKVYSISFWDNTGIPIQIALGESVSYYILINSNEFFDASNNFHQGLPNKGKWSFTTTDTSPPDFNFIVNNAELVENSYDFGFDIKVNFDEPAIVYALALPIATPDPVDSLDIKNDPNTVTILATKANTDYFIPIRGLSTGDYNIFVIAQDFGGNWMNTLYNTAINEAQKVPATAAAFTDLVSEPDVNICVGELQDIIQPITILEGSDDDFSAGALDLILPAGFEFDVTVGSAVIVNSSADITISNFGYRNNTILTLDLTSTGTANRDEIRISGLKIKALPNAVDGSIIVIEEVTGTGTNDIPYADIAANLIVSNLPPALFTMNPVGTTINSNSAEPIALTQVSPIDPFLGESYVFEGNGVNTDSLFVNLAPLGDNTITLTQTFDGGCQAFGEVVVKIIDAQIVGLDFKYCEDIGFINIPQSLAAGAPGNTFNGTYDLESLVADVSQIVTNPGDIASWDPVNFVFDPFIAIPDTSTAEFIAIDFIGLYRNSFDVNDSIPITQTVFIYPAPIMTLESGNLPDLDLDGVISACEDFGDINFDGKPIQSIPSSTGVFSLIKSTGENATLAHLTNTGDGTATINTQDIANDIAGGFGPGLYTLTYTYDNLISTCVGIATLDVIINPKPIANFSLLGRTTFDGCVDEVVTFTNETDILLNSTFVWDFDDPDNAAGANGPTSTLQDPQHFYIADGTYNVTLITTSDKGCISFPVTNIVSVGNNPVTAFNFEQVAIGTPTIFTNTTPTDTPTSGQVLNTNVDTLKWTVNGIFNNMVIDDGTDPELINPFNSTFTLSGPQEVILTAISDKNCTVSDTLDFFTVPEEIATDLSTYREDFDNAGPDKADWITWGGINSSWDVGTSGGDTIMSNSNFWVTGVGTLHNNDEESYVYSPVFNLTGLARPMLQLDKYAHMNSGNGVVIEYTAIDLFGTSKDGVTGDWKLLGALDTGDEWYDFAGISNIGGNQSTGQFGWSGSDSDWERSKHTLTQAKADAPDQNNVRIQFRVSFNSGADNFGEFNGFGFDNVLIGNRTRTVLLENFTSIAQAANTDTENDAINTLAVSTLGATELVVLTYHTSFDGEDTLNLNNPADPAARALFYGISTTPRVVIDGKTGPDESADNSQLLYTDWGEREFNIRTLQIAPFNITLELDRDLINDGKVRIFADLEAIVDIDSNFVVQIAIVEKQVTPSQYSLGTVASGENMFYNTVLKLMPNAGGTRFTDPMLTGQMINISEVWNPTNVAPNTGTTELEVIVFIQDEFSGEILQAERIDFSDDIVLALEQELNEKGVALYPNPADNQLIIKLAKPIMKDRRAIIFDNTGKQVEEIRLELGKDMVELNTIGYRPGIYLFTIPTSTGAITKRFVISHR